MNESKHTPGPWTLDCPSQPENSSVCGPDGKLVVAGECDGYMLPFDCRGREEAIANARLIAAAPELLEACKACLGLFDQGPGGKMTIGELERIIKAAIAKATGEAK